MRKISDPDYVYKPWSEERRKAMSEAARRRVGVPPGHRLLYGVMVEEWKYEHIMPIMRIAREKGHSLESIRWAIGLLVILLSQADQSDQA